MQIDSIDLPSNRKFGFSFSIIFLITGIYFFLIDYYSIFYMFIMSSTLILLLTIFNDDLLSPFNKLWMKFGLLLGKIINPIVLGFIYLSLFTPISILMKIFKRDELNLTFKSQKSNWKKREISYSKNSFKLQF